MPKSGGTILNINVNNEYNDQNDNRHRDPEKSKESRPSSYSSNQMQHPPAKHVKWDQNNRDQPHQGDLTNSRPDLRPRDAYDPQHQESSASSKSPVKSQNNMTLSITIEHSNS